MTCDEFRDQLDEHLAGASPASARTAAEAHAATCPTCRSELEAARALRRAATALSRTITPERDLWPEIHEHLVVSSRRRATQVRWMIPLAAAAAITLVAWVVIRRVETSPAPAWTVAALAGTPRVDATEFSGEHDWRVGQWLETDASSRARLVVGTIGEVRLEPNSRMRLLGTGEADHRVELAQGTMHALVWAPPRLFFVETPSATAIDLGCAYTLSVDDAGAGLLEVTSGYVALEHDERFAIVPAGMQCPTHPETGPGTPYAVAAPPELRAALRRFDQDVHATDVLSEILSRATVTDAITLWHVLTRVPPAAREIVFDKLARFAPPPDGVTRTGIAAGESAMLDRWALDLGLVPMAATASEPSR